MFVFFCTLIAVTVRIEKCVANQYKLKCLYFLSSFSPSSASFVVQRFSQYGTILSHHTAPNGGNWMHIHFATSLQARKALSRNGKILPGNIMIGVVPCIDVVSIVLRFCAQAGLKSIKIAIR